jgi:hypothetical protein
VSDKIRFILVSALTASGLALGQTPLVISTNERAIATIRAMERGGAVISLGQQARLSSNRGSRSR